MIAVAFVLAAAAGTLARWGLSVRLTPPSGTLVANLAGSFLLGLLAGVEGPARTIQGVAALGTLTTFSTLMVELLEIWAYDRRLATGYLTATIVGGVGLAWLGLTLG